MFTLISNIQNFSTSKQKLLNFGGPPKMYLRKMANSIEFFSEKITKRKVKSCIVCLLGKELLWFTDTTKELLVSYKGDILH